MCAPRHKRRTENEVLGRCRQCGKSFLGKFLLDFLGYRDVEIPLPFEADELRRPEFPSAVEIFREVLVAKAHLLALPYRRHGKPRPAIDEAVVVFPHEVGLRAAELDRFFEPFERAGDGFVFTVQILVAVRFLLHLLAHCLVPSDNRAEHRAGHRRVELELFPHGAIEFLLQSHGTHREAVLEDVARHEVAGRAVCFRQFLEPLDLLVIRKNFEFDCLGKHLHFLLSEESIAKSKIYLRGGAPPHG